MAGIGQRFTPSDQSIPWSTPVQYNMVRPVALDTSNPNKTFLNNFPQPTIEKRKAFYEENGELGSSAFTNYSRVAAAGATYGSSSNSAVSALPTPPQSQSQADYGGVPGPSPFVTGGATTGIYQRNGSDGTSSGGLGLDPVALTSRSNSVLRQYTGLDAAMFYQQQQQSRKPASGAPIGSTTTTTTSPSAGLLVIGPGSAAPGKLRPTLHSQQPAPFDPSDFPSLSGRAQTMSTNPVSGSVGQSLIPQAPPAPLPPHLYPATSVAPIRNYLNVMASRPPTLPPPGTGLGIQPTSAASATSNSVSTVAGSVVEPAEFSIEQEDFPALPGAQNPLAPPVGLSISQSGNSTSTLLDIPALSLATSTTASSSQTTGGSAMLQFLANHLVTNIPRQMLRDPFGMIALTKLLKATEIDPTLALLSSGIDLSTLNVPWNFSGDLHHLFTSPWHESCIGRPQDMDYSVPPEYQIRHVVSENLPDPTPDKLADETLFWIFFNCTREEAQIFAARELYRRDWRFLKRDQLWLSRPSNVTPLTNTSEKGFYVVWEPATASKSTRQLTVHYQDLDGFPTQLKPTGGLPFGLHNHHPRPLGGTTPAGSGAGNPMLVVAPPASVQGSAAVVGAQSASSQQQQQPQGSGTQ